MLPSSTCGYTIYKELQLPFCESIKRKREEHRPVLIFLFFPVLCDFLGFHVSGFADMNCAAYLCNQQSGKKQTVRR